MKVRILAGKEEERSVEISEGETYESLLEKLGLNPVEVIVLHDGEPILEEEKVREGGKIEIIRVVSSG